MYSTASASTADVARNFLEGAIRNIATTNAATVPSAQGKKEFWSDDKHIYEITRDLRRNRSIMKSTCAFLDGTKIVSKGWMLAKGYNFECYINMLQTKKGDYFLCFELGHMILRTGRYLS